MARGKAAKSGQKPAKDSVTVATPSPPTTRQMAHAVAEAESPKQTKRSSRAKSKSLESNDAKADTIVVSSPAASTKASTKAASTKAVTKAKKVVKDMADTYDASPAWPLPGIFSSKVQDKGRVAKDILLLATASTLVASGIRLVLGFLATTAEVSWLSWASYLSTIGPPGPAPLLASILARSVRLSVCWGSTTAMSALQALSYVPIVYLLYAHYNIPFLGAFLLGVINAVAEERSLDTYYNLKGTSKGWDEDEEEIDSFEELFREIFGNVAPVLFAAAIYNFVYVQACRFFLPSTLVVYFTGIATVDPARVPSMLRASAPSLGEIFSAVFLSFSAMVASAICGQFSRDFIFGTIPSNKPTKKGKKKATSKAFTRSATFYRRSVTVNSIAASISVGLSIFMQCRYSIPGVDAYGAAVYASIWAVSPLLVGGVLCAAGV